MFKGVEILCSLKRVRGFTGVIWLDQCKTMPFDLRWFCGRDILTLRNFV